jgi:hypothetical protein
VIGNAYKFSVIKPEEKRTYGRTRNRWEVDSGILEK